jgi:recombination protein RecT
MIERFLKNVFLTIRTADDFLLNCTPWSIVVSIMQSAYMGMQLGPLLGQAYLVPFKEKGVAQCTMILGYKGIIELARRAAELQTIYTHLIYENEDYVYQCGESFRLEHTPLPPSDRGSKIIAGYAVANFKNGFKQAHWMWFEDIEKHRLLAKTQAIWSQHPEPMQKKVIIRDMAKYLQLDPDSKFNEAATLDATASIGDKKLLIEDLGVGDIVDADGTVLTPDPPPEKEPKKTASFNKSKFSKSKSHSPQKENPKGASPKKENPASTKLANSKDQPGIEPKNPPQEEKVDKISPMRERVAKVLSTPKISKEGYDLAKKALDVADLPITDINSVTPEDMKTSMVPNNYIIAIDAELDKNGFYKLF